MPPARPYTLVAELTYQCPLHCPYCSNPVDIGGDRWRSELETEHWTRVFREARALGVLQLALTGGEPMLRRDLDELVAAARALGLYSTLVTAGTLLTGERCERLKEAGLDHVQVSIQSPIRTRTTASPATGPSRRSSRRRALRASSGSR